MCGRSKTRKSLINSDYCILAQLLCVYSFYLSILSLRNLLIIKTNHSKNRTFMMHEKLSEEKQIRTCIPLSRHCENTASIFKILFT